MWAASPARKSLPKRIGSATKLRSGAIPLSKIGPSASVQPSSVASRVCSSDQIRSSGQSARSSPAGTWMYRRLTSGERRLCRAKPRGWWA